MESTLEKRPHVEKPAARPAPASGDHAADEHALPKNLRKPGWLTIIAMVLLLVLLLAGLYIVGYVPHHAAEKQAKSDAAEVKNEIPTVIVAAPVESKATTDLHLPCDVNAERETAIFPQTTGYLKTLNVDIQDHVKAGQVLAVIDTPEVDAQLAQAEVGILQAQAVLDKANADLKLADQNMARYDALAKTGQGNVTPQEVQEKQNEQAQAEAAVKEAQTQVEAAQKTVDRLKVLQGFEKVTAPFAGTITARNYDIGALLTASATAPGKEMFHLMDTDPMRVFVQVPQGYAGEIKIGGPAYLTTNDEEFKGTVARSSEAVDPNTRTMLFELHFPNPEGKLYPGMYGMARLEVSQSRPTLMIPGSALRFDAGGVRVAVVKDGVVHLQPVTPGRDFGKELEIVQGLQPDSQVITNPGERLEEGSRVNVKEEAPAAEGKKPAVKEASSG